MRLGHNSKQILPQDDTQRESSQCLEGRDQAKSRGRETVSDSEERRGTQDPQGIAEDEQGAGVTLFPAGISIRTRNDCSFPQGEVRMGGVRLMLVV